MRDLRSIGPWPYSWPRRRYGEERGEDRGQSVVELALILPLLLFLFLAVADFARIYAAVLTIESAAREAADYGTQYPWLWSGDPGDPSSNAGKTVAEMRTRACLASSSLTDYAGPDTNCSNPAFDYTLDGTPAGVPPAQCSGVARTSTPCNVTVSLTFTFRLFVPVSIDLFGQTLGLAPTWTFDRASTFAVSDFALDQPPSPSPTASP